MYLSLNTPIPSRARGTGSLVGPGRADFSVPPIIPERMISSAWAGDENYSNFSTINEKRMFHARLAGFEDEADPREGRMSSLSGASFPSRLDPSALRNIFTAARDSLDGRPDPTATVNKTSFNKYKHSFSTDTPAVAARRRPGGVDGEYFGFSDPSLEKPNRSLSRGFSEPYHGGAEKPYHGGAERFGHTAVSEPYDDGKPTYSIIAGSAAPEYLYNEKMNGYGSGSGRGVIESYDDMLERNDNERKRPVAYLRRDTESDMSRRDEIFVNVLQPGVYSVNENTRAVDSNVGINAGKSNNNTISLIEAPEASADRKRMARANSARVAQPAQEDVFDPRATSYGPSYRTYFEPNSGTVRYFYDDVNAVRMPNYLSRNHLDMFSFADTTGPMRSNFVRGVTLDDVRVNAEGAWHDSQVQFRTDMQSKMMAGVNARSWQRRIAPIRTF